MLVLELDALLRLENVTIGDDSALAVDIPPWGRRGPGRISWLDRSQKIVGLVVDDETTLPESFDLAAFDAQAGGPYVFLDVAGKLERLFPPGSHYERWNRTEKEIEAARDEVE